MCKVSPTAETANKRRELTLLCLTASTTVSIENLPVPSSRQGSFMSTCMPFQKDCTTDVVPAASACRVKDEGREGSTTVVRRFTYPASLMVACGRGSGA